MTKESHIQFRSGPHTLIAKTIEGHYPNYRNVIPGYLPRIRHHPGNPQAPRSSRGCGR